MANILSQDGKILVNYDNIASLYMQKKYVQYSHPDTWWEIRVLYPSASKDVECTLAKFDDEKECELVFRKMTSLIAQHKEDYISISSIISIINT